MKRPLMQPRSLYVTIAVLILGLVLLVYGVLLWYQVRTGHEQMLTQARDLFARIGREAQTALDVELRPAGASVAVLAQSPLVQSRNEPERLAALPNMAAVLRNNPAVTAVYGGTDSGSFLLLRRLDDVAAQARVQAPPASRFAAQRLDRDTSPARRVFNYYDASMKLIEERVRPDYEFDPRTRPWFALAQRANGGVIQTAPYLFFTTREVGVSLAAAREGGAVGADVSLASLQALLARQQISPSAELALVTPDGDWLASSRGAIAAVSRPASAAANGLGRLDEVGSNLMRQLWTRRDASGRLAAVQEIEGRRWIAHAGPLSEVGAGPNGAPIWLVVAAPQDELQADQIKAWQRSLWLTAGLLIFVLPLVHWIARSLSKPLFELERQATAISRFEFGGADAGRSFIREVDQLALATNDMKYALQRFLEISSALSAERDFDALLARILDETISVTQASGGAIHLLSADGCKLEPSATRWRDRQDLTALPLTWQHDDVSSSSPVAVAVREGRIVQELLRWDDPAHLGAYRDLFSRLGVSQLRLLALPLRNRQREVIGSLTLGFELPSGQEDIPHLTASRVAFVEALSGTAAVAIDNQLLMRARKELLDSFIQLVAGAIDAKSPYTGGHCQRVPELTKLLAQAACDAKEGPFADFALDAEGWEALHIAAWLHDCGKVTTPEFVVDKATKLETIYNRIHEIRTRFEVLKRDATIERLEMLVGLEAAQRVRQELAELHAKLDEDFAFVANCNLGSESLEPAHVDRLREIGQRRWWRTLDNTLGLSLAEHKRLPKHRPALPVQERLLADRPEHVVRRGASDRMPANNPWGFKIDEPEHLYHHGELYNLCVNRGTLTDEERHKINDHIVQTLRMLHELPFPKHLRNVPEIAGGHHERVDGKGYPRGLTRDEMSVPARMMAIADVFEALTADDRPYKPGKPLSEALEIMGRMSREGHIDRDLFELFLRSGACMRYAQGFLKPNQLDVTRPEDYL